MNQYIKTAKKFIIIHKKKLTIVAGAAIGLLAIVTLITLVTRSTAPNVVYQPVEACKLFTSIEANKLLRVTPIESTNSQPVITKDTAVSKCGYTDGNTEVNAMKVAAVIVRSGINDAGVLQNQSEFASGKTSDLIETVKGVGDSAYFNKGNGQLNVLDGRNWIIISYGVGSSPQNNNKDDAIKLASIVVSGSGEITNF